MNILPQNLNGKGLRIGIVQARFTNEIGSAMVEVARISRWQPWPAHWK